LDFFNGELFDATKIGFFHFADDFQFCPAIILLQSKLFNKRIPLNNRKAT